MNLVLWTILVTIQKLEKERIFGLEKLGEFDELLFSCVILVRLLGDFRESPQPYLYLITHMSSFKSKIVGGVNFASGGAGLFDDTGKANFVSLFNYLFTSFTDFDLQEKLKFFCI